MFLGRCAIDIIVYTLKEVDFKNDPRNTPLKIIVANLWDHSPFAPEVG